MSQPFVPYQMIPYPYGVPVQNQEGPSLSDPPARVKVALEFLRNLSAKTSPRAAVNDLSIEWADVSSLSKKENEAQDAACNMLQEYFAGKLMPDHWDRNEGVTAFDGRVGTVIRCMVCYPNHVKPDCVLCRGAGQLIVFPTSEGDPNVAG